MSAYLRYIVLLLDFALVGRLPASETPPAKGVVTVIKWVNTFLDEVNTILDTLSSGKVPAQTKVGGQMGKKLDEFEKQLSDLEVPTTKDLTEAGTPDQLIAHDLVARRAEFDKLQAYITKKRDEVALAKTTSEKLAGTSQRAAQSGKALDKLSKGLQNIVADPATMKKIEDYILDIELNLKDKVGGIVSTSNRKKEAFDEAIASTSRHLDNIQSILDVLRKITAQEEARKNLLGEIRAERIALSRKVQLQRTQAKAYLAERDQATRDKQQLAGDKVTIDAMKYDACPNGHLYGECTHDNLKQGWMRLKNDRENAWSFRVKANQRAMENLNDVKLRLNDQASRLEDEMTAMEEKMKRLEKEDRESEQADLVILRDLVTRLRKSLLPK